MKELEKIISKEDVANVASQMLKSFNELLDAVIVFAVVIYLVLMYVLTKVIIEKNEMITEFLKQNIEIKLGYFTEDILFFIKDDILRKSRKENCKEL